MAQIWKKTGGFIHCHHPRRHHIKLLRLLKCRLDWKYILHLLCTSQAAGVIDFSIAIVWAAAPSDQIAQSAQVPSQGPSQVTLQSESTLMHAPPYKILVLKQIWFIEGFILNLLLPPQKIMMSTEQWTGYRSFLFFLHFCITIFFFFPDYSPVANQCETLVNVQAVLTMKSSLIVAIRNKK